MDIKMNFPSSTAVTDVYTDLNGLQNLRAEKNQDEALKKVAQQFESMFMNLLLKNMRNANSVFEKDSLFNSNESNFYRDMYDQQLSLTLANKKGIGIADVMYRQLSGRYGDAPQDVPAADRSSSEGIGDKAGRHAALPGQQAVAELRRARPNIAPLSPSESLQPSATPAPSAATEAAVEGTEFSGAPADFVEKVLPFARQAAKVLGLNPFILVAQAALETGWGKHVIADDKGVSSNNLFNIKADRRWSGDSVKASTLEYEQGVMSKETASFRRYADITASFNDFVEFITTQPRYQQALKQVDDPRSFITELHNAGYATDPRYSEKVMTVLNGLEAGRFGALGGASDAR